MDPLLFEVHFSRRTAAEDLARAVMEEVSRLLNPFTHVPVICCVGSPDSSGDAVGPLVGTELRSRGFAYPVIGTMAEPIGRSRVPIARYLAAAASAMRGRRPFTIAIDAAVGRPGYITLHNGPLLPGTAKGLKLPPVGKLHILVGTAILPHFLELVPIEDVRTYAHIVADAFYAFGEQWDQHTMAEYALEAAASEMD